MYYLLGRSNAAHPCRLILDYPYIDDVDWSGGVRFGVPILDPLTIVMEPLETRASDQSSDMPEYFKGEIPLFRNDLVDTFFKAGVDNLDLYNTVIVDPDDGKKYTNYKAGNIIGAVAAADMAQSKATVHPGGPVIDVDFDGLVVDEKKAQAHGALIFRLAESVNAILVHQSLRDKLLAAGFDKLEFLDPKDCAL